MLKSAIPVIAITDSKKSEDYYCRVLGFQLQFAYRPDPARNDPAYLGVARDGVVLHLQSFKANRAGHTDAFLRADDVDALFTEFTARDAIVHMPPTNQDWNNRELGIRDLDGNVLVFAMPPKK